MEDAIDLPCGHTMLRTPYNNARYHIDPKRACPICFPDPLWGAQRVPQSVWSGTFKVMGVELKCHVLSNGQRIIEADSVRQFFESVVQEDVDELRDAAAGERQSPREDVQSFADWLSGRKGFGS